MPWTLAGPVRYEEVVKGSRFIAKAAPVGSEAEALAFLEAAREEEATHNPYAYRIGPIYRFSDDGEPSGTAGRPILHALEALDLDGVAVLVVRYFGGVKLGAGGLVRAYGRAAAEALKRGERVPLVPKVPLRFRIPFAELGRVHRLLDRYGLKAEETYGEGVVFRLELPQDQAEALWAEVHEATRGQADRL